MFQIPKLKYLRLAARRRCFRRERRPLQARTGTHRHPTPPLASRASKCWCVCYVCMRFFKCREEGIMRAGYAYLRGCCCGDKAVELC